MDPRQNQLQPEMQANHQRFSWQPSPPDEEAPPYEPPQQHTQRVGGNVDRQNRAFSYAQTPIEHRDPYYMSSQNHPPLPQQSPPTPIDSRPQSFYTVQNPAVQNQAPTYYTAQSDTPEKTPFPTVPPQTQTQYQAPFSPDSYGTQIDTQRPNHARKLSNLSPINTNVPSRDSMPPVPQIPSAHRTEADPLPAKTPISSGPITNHGLTPVDNRKSAAEPYSPHGFPTSPAHAVFSPHAAHGPNGLDFSLHQPGQIAHPNMDLSNGGKPHKWKNGLFSCISSDISTCLTGLFCPCILYGRTSYRLNQKAEKKDPTDMLGASATNGHCALMSAACGLWWLFPMIQRTKIRHLYKVGGNLGGDILRGCCCCCCVAIQNEREVKGREESSRRWAGPASTVPEVYTSGGMMNYKPQQ